jgi:hypothetical protein
MINKHGNISVGVYWDDVGIPGWMLSGRSNTRAIICSKNCEKYSRSTLGVHDIYVATETGGQMRAVVYYSVRLRKSGRERARDLRRDAQIWPQ